MKIEQKITGVILAGGRAKRMHEQDKGLVEFNNQAMVCYAIAAMTTVVDTLLINANRNIERYQQWGYAVVSDQTATFDGPLAGILTAMLFSQTSELLVVPCDSPFIRAEPLQKLIDSRRSQAADIAIAFDGDRLHPVFMAVNTALASDLQQYLAAGERKVEQWLARHHTVLVDFSSEPSLFTNINTLNELSALEKQTH